VAPSLYLTTPQAADNLRRYVEEGGTLVVGGFSGIVDANDRVYPGPYPGAFRDVLGLTVEEWLPLRAGDRVGLTWDEPGIAQPAADAWTEAVILAGAKPVAWYADGRRPAVPRSPNTTWAKAAPGTFPPAPTPDQRRCSPPPAPRPASTRLPPRFNGRLAARPGDRPSHRRAAPLLHAHQPRGYRGGRSAGRPRRDRPRR